MRARPFIILCFFTLSFSSHAQEINIKDTVENEYIRSFFDYINVRGITSFRNLSIGISEKGNPPQAQYSPNNRGFIGFGAFLFDVGVEVAFKFPQAFERNRDVYGTTDFIDVQSHIYGKAINFDLAFQQYEGFYISNVGDFEHFFEDETPQPVRGDLKATNFMLNMIYLFNSDKFSFRSAFNQTEKQLKNAGSFLVLTSFSYFRLRGDSALFYSENINPNSTGISLVDGNFNTVSVLPGYSYNFTWKNFLLNFTASAGAGLQRQVYTLENKEGRAWQIEPKYNVRAALTYDNDRFFTGAYYYLHNSYTSINSMRIQTEVTNFRVFAGYRFPKFGIFKKYSIHQILNPIKKGILGEDGF